MAHVVPTHTIWANIAVFGNVLLFIFIFVASSLFFLLTETKTEIEICSYTIKNVVTKECKSNSNLTVQMRFFFRVYNFKKNKTPQNLLKTNV